MQPPVILLGNFAILGWMAFLLAIGGIVYLFYLRGLEKKRIAERIEREKKINETRNQELEWYREKRFLMEQQALEKQARLAQFTRSPYSPAAARLFFLAECIREERQRLGTDISSLILTEKRLLTLIKEGRKQAERGINCQAWLSEAEIARHLIQSHREDFRKSQNLLRTVLGQVGRLEEKARGEKLEAEEAVPTIRVIKEKIGELPTGLRSSAQTSSREVQAVILEFGRQMSQVAGISDWTEQLVVDLFSKNHPSGGQLELLEAADEALMVFQGNIDPEENPIPKSPKTEREETEKKQPAPVEEKKDQEISVTESIWATPQDQGPESKPVPGSSPERLVVFCSNDPSIWNTDCSESDTHRAIPINEITGDEEWWLGIKRLDSGQEVFGQVTLDDLRGVRKRDESETAGFNGTNEFFYGARHLGFFSETCASEVETLFCYGGWGFGHLSNGYQEGEEEEQAFGWDGEKIEAGTVFEFTLYDDRPPQATDRQIIL